MSQAHVCYIPNMHILIKPATVVMTNQLTLPESAIVLFNTGTCSLKCHFPLQLMLMILSKHMIGLHMLVEADICALIKFHRDDYGSLHYDWPS